MSQVEDMMQKMMRWFNSANKNAKDMQDELSSFGQNGYAKQCRSRNLSSR